MKTMWLAGVALGASLALTGAASAQDITIGVAGPMTGQYASFGTQLKNGAEAAVADINAAGGVMGKKLKLEIGDDACDPKQARAVGEKFASMKVPFVAGHYCSSSSIPASEAYQDGNVLQITPASTNPPRKRPTAAAVVKKFKDKNVDPEGYTLYTYAAMQIWSQAVAKAKTTDAKKVAETIKGGKWDTVLGPISYDKKGDITTVDYVFYKWSKDGKYDEIPAGKGS